MNATTNGIKKTSTANLMAVLERIRSSPKIILLISASAAITLIIALLFWAKSPDYRVLFSNITDQDGGAIVSQLAQMNVPYRFEDRGGAIMVPADKVYEARLKLAQLGLPKGGAVGFELLDQEKFGISQFSEQVNFQRALEGELSRTIETLGSVNGARVHLAMPKPSMFVREQKQPSASVTVRLNNGRLLEGEQVSAITYLIASAVPGLSADSVTIVDQNGRLLTQRGGQTTQTSQLKFTSEVEADFQQRIQSILSPIVGRNNVKSQVTAQLDFTLHEQTAEQFQPNTAPDRMSIRSSQSSDAEQGGKGGVGGVPGALSNQPSLPATAPITQAATPTAPGATGAAGAATAGATGAKGGAATVATPIPFNNRRDNTTNYELDRTLTHIKRSTGSIERLSIAVVINYLPTAEGESAPLPKEQMEQISALVKEAVGFSAERGDTVNIVNSPFNNVEEEVAPPFWQQAGFINLLMAAGRYLLVAIVAWLFWRKAIKPAWLRNQELILARLELEKEARQAELDAHKRKAESGERAKAEQRVEAELNTQNLRELAEQEPRVVALVIREWINKELKS
ncbi:MULTISPECIES: flagellar basal-body MS-ring/collar protein FliF [Yersinia]|uniref:Flagellar M-ring protein n=2 Tax=Yersinia bercovieri TaxID=634 RepID=A0A2G4U6M2_YERBE|nr:MULTISPECIES: flagellar basal-body MS-ring/collar protein FliF [Yersinia]EEQ08228.1 Flagellar M-ring protein [Yersinia bercovieri ATCC 43970]MDN0101557.1 flagellar basal-body MS-ring/collar protein FliF [Yersinia bercovieri]PHZ28938.1 flagellar basal body M-ring protein FliF [Yersinia bercovieri]QDW32104.1 flagellar basal body M-ring protein FliF [Yersinia sp. KBS0713]QKJ06059.1 flagellar M-ring protein FliF [Yersinia bercovieri ATCC 43970]